MDAFNLSKALYAIFSMNLFFSFICCLGNVSELKEIDDSDNVMEHELDSSDDAMEYKKIDYLPDSTKFAKPGSSDDATEMEPDCSDNRTTSGKLEDSSDTTSCENSDTFDVFKYKQTDNTDKVAIYRNSEDPHDTSCENSSSSNEVAKMKPDCMDNTTKYENSNCSDYATKNDSDDATSNNMHDCSDDPTMYEKSNHSHIETTQEMTNCSDSITTQKQANHSHISMKQKNTNYSHTTSKHKKYKHSEVAKKFKEAGICPNITLHSPKKSLQIDYPGGYSVNFGNELPISKIKNAPAVTYNASSCPYHFLIMIDPDLPPGNIIFLHWAVGNIPGNNVTAGDEFADYIPPVPITNLNYKLLFKFDDSPLTSAQHRYIFLLYKQDEILDPKKTSSILRPHENLEKLKEYFGIENFKLTGGNYFRAELDRA